MSFSIDQELMKISRSRFGFSIADPFYSKLSNNLTQTYKNKRFNNLRANNNDTSYSDVIIFIRRTSAVKCTYIRRAPY